MRTLLCLVAILFSIGLTYFSVKYFLKKNKELWDYKKDFIQYLEINKDTDGLVIMGVMNRLGVREDSPQKLTWIMSGLKKQIKSGHADEMYIKFYDICLSYHKKGFFVAVVLTVSSIIIALSIELLKG